MSLGGSSQPANRRRALLQSVRFAPAKPGSGTKAFDVGERDVAIGPAETRNLIFVSSLRYQIIKKEF
jgi:hypothetical protein